MSIDAHESLRLQMAEAAWLPADDPQRLATEAEVQAAGPACWEEWSLLLAETEALAASVRSAPPPEGLADRLAQLPDGLPKVGHGWKRSLRRLGCRSEQPLVSSLAPSSEPGKRVGNSMKKPYEDDLFSESTMSFGEHIEELRTCLIKGIYGFVLGFLIGLWFGTDVVKFIQQPVHNALVQFYQDETSDSQEFIGEPYFVDAAMLRAQLDGKPLPKREPNHQITSDDLVEIRLYQDFDHSRLLDLTTLSAQEAFSIYVMAALIFGLVISSPWIFYQAWAFVASGLYPHERKYVHVFLPISLGLFLAGAALAFFFVFEPVLGFLFYFNKLMDIRPDIRIGEWMRFVLILPVGFGLAFQLPLVMLFLERIQIMSVSTYTASWRHSVLGIFIISMLLTPADPYSMLLMAIPLCVLYAFGIWLCKYMPSLSPVEEEEEPAAARS